MRDGHARTLQARAPGATDLHPHGTAAWNASRLRPGRRSGAALAAGVTAAAALAAAAPATAAALLHAVMWPVLGAGLILRATALASSRRPAVVESLPEGDDLPVYTIVAPLYRERRVAVQLVEALRALDYPRDRLQVLLVLEADDLDTWCALTALDLAPPFEIFVAPPGSPRTKPRACNEALSHARGDFLVIYDAEDRPDPAQLREACARFRADPGLACLQAPLRVDRARCFLQRQFALEYAAQFEVMLPALHRLGVPFPLGGSSNHFRTPVLRELGGWDPHNVTEDADLGFRLAAAGKRSGLLRAPTWELAPRSAGAWLRQRSRWLKGYLQTWCVHHRRPAAGGWRRLVALEATLGLGLISAFGHGPLLTLMLATGAASVLGLAPAGLPLRDVGLAAAGWGMSVAVMGVGARRAGLRLRWWDALGAPLYWPLHSIAAIRALAQWFTAPFHWDKTDHRPIR